MHYRLFTLLAAAMIAAGIGACGGEGKSFDPLGTDRLAFGDSSGSAVLQLDPNGAVQLTAKVKDAAGKDVAEREVAFEFVANASGATISSTRVSTNTAGEAAILYRAGGASGSDVIRASLSSGARIDVSITVGSGAGGVQVAVTASSTALTAGQSSILTATVKNSAGTPLKGQAVTFAFAANNSGARLATLSGTTDVSGRAVAAYTAGADSPAASVEDIVQAAAAGSVEPVVITRTAAGGVQIALTGTPTSLAAGQNSILTATVTDSAGSPMQGQTVTFAFSPNGNRSGAALAALSGVTDVSGRALAVYTAGSTSPTTGIEDTVQATVAGSAAVIVITRTTAGGGGGLTLGLASSATSLAAGQTAVVTATVTDGSSAPVSGQAVTFAFAPGGNNSGATLTALSGTTDASGKAVARYTAGAASPAADLQDTVLASVAGSAAAVVITRTVGSAAGFQIAVTAAPASLATGATSIITAQVTNAAGAAAAGQTVSFAFIGGASPSGATLTPLNGGVTDAGGKVLAVYTAGSLSPGLSVQDTVSATVTGATAVVIITRLAASGTGNRISSLTASPAALPTTSSNSIVTATVVSASNTPMPGVTVNFSKVTGNGSFVTAGDTSPVSTAVTDNSGKALATFAGPGGAAHAEAVIRAEIVGGDAVVIISW